MHFALPQRKTSRPPPYVASRPVPSSFRRRGRLKLLFGILGVVLFLIILLSQFRGGRSQRPRHPKPPPNTPRVVLVTTIEATDAPSYRDLLEQNRRHYASRHNYGVFIVNSADYDVSVPPNETTVTMDPPIAWAKIPAMRHAMAKFPYSTYFFFLDHYSFIANPKLSLERHITNPGRLETLMIPNQPVVPPDSVIKTIPNLRAAEVDLVMTQDREGLRQESFILRRGEWAKFFLDSWFDPLYRSYNFQRAEGHALEHLVQWHGTILARLALVPQRVMNAYYVSNDAGAFKMGDFVANLHHCDNSTTRSCEAEAKAIDTMLHDYLDEK